MAATEKTVRLAARLYEMRDFAKRMLGERYAEQMSDLRTMIETVQSKLHFEEPLAAATKICTVNKTGGVQTAYIMAAAVEMIEPSAQQQKPNDG